MNPIHFGPKRRFWLVRAVGAVVMTAAAAAMAKSGFGTVVGWTGIIGVVFFGVGAVVCLIQGTRAGPRLTLDKEGVHDRTLGVGVIAWSDITSTAPYWVAKMPFIGLHLREPAKYVARASAFKRMLARINSGSGMPAFSLNLAGVDADPTYVAELVTRMRRKLGRLEQAPAPVVESDDDWDGDSPSAERVARRALVLAALAERAAGRRSQHEIIRWLADVGAAAECEPEERRLLEAPNGSLTTAELMNASWQTEGVAVLAWALDRTELPPFDRQYSREAVDALGSLQSPSLRTEEEITELAGHIFTVHWRLREFLLRKEPLDFNEVAARTKFGLDLTGLPLVGGDLAIDGLPLCRVPEQRWRECLSIAAERHRAVNWLMGFEELYSEITADT